jgi:hypothetical protein
VDVAAGRRAEGRKEREKGGEKIEKVSKRSQKCRQNRYVLSRVTVEGLLEATLVEVVRNETNGATEDEKTVEGSDLRV